MNKNGHNEMNPHMPSFFREMAYNFNNGEKSIAFDFLFLFIIVNIAGIFV